MISLIHKLSDSKAMQQSRVYTFIISSIITSIITTIFLYLGWIQPIGALAIILALGGITILKLSRIPNLYQSILRPIYSYTIVILLAILIIRGLEYNSYIQQAIPWALTLTQLLAKVEMSIVAHIIALAWVMTALDRKCGIGVTIENNIDRSNWSKDKIFNIIITTIAVIVYIAIIWYMQRFTGNFQDDIHHMVAARSLVIGEGIPVLNAYNLEGYFRGLPITLLVSGLFYIFGISREVAKIAPALLGLISLFAYLYIVNQLIKDKLSQFIAIILYVVSPWLILNTFFIRGYIFLQASLMLLGALTLFTHNSIVNKKWSRVIIGIVLMSCIAYINYFGMNDSTYILIPISYICGLLGLFLISFPKKILSLQKKLSILSITGIVGLVGGSFFLDYIGLIRTLIGGAETNTTGKHIGFNEFFLLRTSWYTLLAAIGVFTISKLDTKKVIIFILFLPLIFLHYISDYSLQLMRGLVYIVPVFYLLVAIGLESLFNVFYKIKKIIIIVPIIIIMGLYIRTDTQLIMSNGYPVFPRELGYLEFEKMYDYIKDNLEDVVLVNIAYTLQSSKFYGVEIDYFLDTVGELDGHYLHYVDEKGIRRHFYLNTPVIQKEDEFVSLYSSQDKQQVCLITQSFSKRFLTKSTQLLIEQNFESEAKFASLEILCQKDK